MVDFLNLYNNPDTDRTTTTANFTIAASISNIMVESTDLLQVGVNIFISDGTEFVYLTVTAINSPTDFNADKISGSADALVVDSGATVQVVGPEGTAGFASPLTTKGDILTYDTADVRLGVGADGQVLTANSATGTGLEWAAAGTSGVATQDEGISVDPAATTLNFVGAGVTATDAGSNITTVTIPGGTSGVATEDEGISVDPAATTLNFVGAGVTATDAGSNVTTVTIPGGGGSSPLTTKGDLYTYDTADQRLAIGTDGQILSANSATATGLEWIANTGGGGGGSGTSWTEVSDLTTLPSGWNDLNVDTTSVSKVVYRHDGQSLKFRATYRVASLNAANIVQPYTTFSNLVSDLGLTLNLDLWGKGSDGTEILVFKYGEIVHYDSSFAAVNAVTTGDLFVRYDVNAGLVTGNACRTKGSVSSGSELRWGNSGSIPKAIVVGDWFVIEGELPVDEVGGGSGGSGGGGYDELLGDGIATSFVVNHNLGTRNVVVEVYRNSGGYDKVYPEINHTDDNNVTIDFTTTTPTTDEFAVFITSGGGGAGGREILTADRTYYVSTTGNDTNDGLTVGTPFLTIQKAIDVAAALDGSIYNVTIQLADGTYNLTSSLILKDMVGSGSMTLQGNTGDQSLVILDGGGTLTPGFVDYNANATKGVIKWIFRFFTMQNTGNDFLPVSGERNILTIENLNFGGTMGASRRILYSVGRQPYIVCNGTFNIDGTSLGTPNSAIEVLSVQGDIYAQSTTWNITGSPTFNTAFALCARIGTMTLIGTTVTGTFTGTGIRAQEESVIIQTSSSIPNGTTTSTGGVIL